MPNYLPVAVVVLAVVVVLVVQFYLSSEVPIVESPNDMIGCNFAARSDCFPTKGDEVAWNTWILRHFNEKPLETYRTPVSYRLVLLPTFDPPITIRINVESEGKSLTIKRLSGQGGFGDREMGKLSFEVTKTFEDADWNQIVSRIDDAEFWNTSPYTDEDPVTDGAIWYLEGIDDGRKNFVRRITPNQKLKALFWAIIGLAGESARYEGY